MKIRCAKPGGDVEVCSANIENKDLKVLPSGARFPTKDAGITEMKRVMAWLKEKGRTDTDEKVEWRVL